MHTEWGKVMATLSEDVDEETPLQVRLNGAATAIGKMGLLVAVFTFIVLMIRCGAGWVPFKPYTLFRIVIRARTCFESLGGEEDLCERRCVTRSAGTNAPVNVC